MHIGLRRVERQSLKSGFCSECTGGPIGLWINTPQCAKQRFSNPQRQGIAPKLFHHMQSISPVPPKTFITTIARQGDCDVPTRHFTNPVGWHGRAVGKRLIVMARQCVYQIKVIAFLNLQMMFSAISACNLLGIGCFIELGVVETDGTGLNRQGRLLGHRRHHHAGINATRQKSTQWHICDHSQAHRFINAAS